MIIKNVHISDRIGLKDGPGEIDSNGYLRLRRVVLGKPGVLEYLGSELPSELGFDDDEIVPILRPSEEVFKPESIATMKGIPFLVGDEHVWITPDKNASDGSIAGEPVVKNNEIIGEITVTSSKAIEGIRSGKFSDISPMYTSDLAREIGEYNGKRYLLKQANIRYNHILALPPGKGRAGKDVKIQDKGFTMELITMDTGAGLIKIAPGGEGTIKSLMDACAEKERERVKLGDSNATLEARLADHDAIVKERDDLKEKVSKLEGEKAALTAELGDAKSPEKLEAAAKELSGVQAVGKVIMGDKMPTGLGSSELRKAIAIHYAGDMGIKVDGKDDGYLSGIYDTAAVHAARTGDKKTVIGAGVVTGDKKADTGGAHPATKNWGYKAPGGSK